MDKIMTGKQSSAMDKAQIFILSGGKPVEAAKKFDVRVNSIYRKIWYKAYRQAQSIKEQRASLQNQEAPTP